MKSQAETGNPVLSISENPSDDEAYDSRNARFWSPWKKRSLLFTLCLAALLTDWGMTWGSPLFVAQAETWKMTPVDVSASLSGGIFLQGAGGLFAVPFTQRYGRLPVLFWSQFLTCVLVIGASQAESYAGFTATRTIQGLVGTAPQIIGLSIIHDMYFFREHARKVNLWGYCFLAGPFLGPFVSGLLITKIDWRATYGVLAALYGFSSIVVAVLGDETLFDKEESRDASSFEKKGLVKKPELLTGLAAAKVKGRPSIITVFFHTISIGLRPHVLVISMTYYMLSSMWSVGLATTIPQLISPPPYQFSPTATALLYLSPAIGGFIGEIWGHFFNDYLCNSYLHRNNGRWLPEQRLWAVYPAVIVAVCALVLIGQSLEKGLHWAALAIGWGMYSAACVTATAGISTYMLDCFPHHAALVSSIVNFWRTTGGFCVVYFQLKWVALNGAAVTFGCQAAIVVAGFLGVIATQIWGGKWRELYPAPTPEN